MSLSVLGTAANVFGVITSSKDLGEIIKGIADSVQEVKANEESTSYWDKTLKDHAKEIYTFMVRCKEAGANESQTHSLLNLLESLIVLRKEIVENSRRWYLNKLWATRDIRRKLERVERKMKHCQDLFVADTLSTHTGMLLRVDKRVREIADREGRSSVVGSTAFRWKAPGKADRSDPMAIEYAYLAKKSHAFIYELKSNSGYIQKLLLETDHNIQTTSFQYDSFPEGNPLSECEDVSSRTIGACQKLRTQNWDNTSFMDWLIDNERLSDSLFKLGLKKEARQIQELINHMWLFLASRIGSSPIYSHLASSLRELAMRYSHEGRHGEALSLVEQAIQIYRSIGDSFLPDLARCLSDRSYYLYCLFRFEGSLESAQESVGILRSLVEDDPSLYGPQLVLSFRCQALTLISLSQHEGALKCSQEALQWLSKLSTQYRQVHSAQYAWTSWLIAELHHNLGDHEQAREYGRKALSVFHAFIRDRPLYYSHNLSFTLNYSSWFDHESALTVLDESLAACLTVDTNITTPLLADIHDHRAAVLVSNTRYKEALDSYNQAIDIRCRLLEDEEDVDFKHFKGLLQSFRLRSSCLFSLHRQRDALSSVDAAQNAIVSRLRNEINEDTKDFIIEELKEQHKLLGDPTWSDCIELTSSLKSCKEVLSQIHKVKCASRIGHTTRSDLGVLSTMECEIYLILS